MILLIFFRFSKKLLLALAFIQLKILTNKFIELIRKNCHGVGRIYLVLPELCAKMASIMTFANVFYTTLVVSSRT
jgi:hypothetical protein